MKNIQAIADKSAMSLSFLCTVHCLALPFVVVMLPSLAVFNLEDEVFHLWMIVAVVPVSLFALRMGCKKHRDFKVMLLGAVGIIILIVTALFGHDVFGEMGEKLFTVLGAGIVALGHWINHRLCKHSNYDCHS